MCHFAARLIRGIVSCKCDATVFPPCSHLSSSVMEQNHPAMPPSPGFFFTPLQSGAAHLMSHFLYPAHRAVCVEVHSGSTFASNLRGSFEFKA